MPNPSSVRFPIAPIMVTVLLLATAPLGASDLVITGVVDGPLTGGIPKAIELCATADIADLSLYGVGSANNGGGTDGEEFTFPAVGVSAGTFVYVASEASGFSTFFGFAPDYTSGALAINGDDAMELFMSGSVVDVFGDINVDGTGQPWEYTDGWGYRVDGTGPDGTTFMLGNWTFSGPGALAGETSNATAATPFPIGSYSSCTPRAPWVINEIHADPASDLSGDANGDGVRDATQDEFVEIVNNSGLSQDISGWTLADGFSVRHTFPGGTVVPAGCTVVVFGGGVPTGSFGNSVVQTAASGALGLNNSGDSLTLNDGSTDVATASYGSEGGDNQSLTLEPDVTGTPPYVKHTLATGSGGTLYSPGTLVDGSQFSGCAAPSAPWVINEIHADPASDITGDANGDGVRNASADEFVEIVNNSGATMDISGWTLADGFSVRHVFPAGSVVLDQCSVVVFGGGTPTGAFGGSLVQTASTGSVSLNNGGDTITLNDGIADVNMASYGGEGGDNQSLTLDPDVSAPPYVKHTLATGSGGALYSPGTRIDGSQFSGCPVMTEIYEIQGNGAASPLTGALVITADNAVTALRDTGSGIDGFFMQTPAARTDGNVDTSDGIFVFTGADPGVAVGDRVTVTGDVFEFFGFTEIVTDPSNVVVVGTGATPAPVTFDALTPSGDPALPSCAIEFECYEGMLVAIFDGTVTGPNQRFGTDPIAEVHITAAPARTFREPGVEFPGLFMPPIPTWDGNPEVFELDPNRLGLANQIIPAGSSFSASGVLGFEFGGYELWPTVLDVTPAPLPVPVRTREPGEMTVGTLNLFRLFDDVDDPPSFNFQGEERDDFVATSAVYARRLAKLSAYVREVLDSPDILAVQEAEKLGVLEDLAARIEADDPSVVYSAHLLEGNDIGTIDIGFLTRRRIQVDTLTQVDPDATFINPITNEPDILHDRPPLLLEGRCELEFGSYPISVLAVHNRSLGSIDSPSQGERVRLKRLLQAESVAAKAQELQDADPAVRLVVLGDFNAFEFTDGYVDALAVIRGDFDPTQSLVCTETTCPGDLVEPDLTNQVTALAAAERYSFIFRGSAQVLDHALTSEGLFEVTGAEFGRGNADAAVDLINDDGTLAAPALRSSDHDGLVVYILKDEDDDGVPNDDDVCPGTVVPEGVPTEVLGVSHWALVDGDGHFDTTPPAGRGPNFSFSLGDTAGCSCEQIIVAQGLGEGHVKFGCSNSAMLDWVMLVNPERVRELTALRGLRSTSTGLGR